jgi:hypothetical protein
MPWARMLAYVTGTVNQELLLRNEYLAAENRILRKSDQGSAAAFGRREGDVGRNRSPARTGSTEGYRGNGDAGYDLRLVSETHRSKVRWFEIS